MNSLEKTGEALLLAHEGNRQIALAVWTAITTGARRFGNFLWTAISLVPGPHTLP